MFRGLAVLVPLVGLAACGGADSTDPLTRMERLARMNADLGETTSIEYLNSLDGSFTYSGYSSVVFSGNVEDTYSDAMAEIDITANFSGSGEDYVTGQIHSLESLDPNDSYEGNLVFSREPIQGTSVNGTYQGGLRLTTTEGTSETTTTFATGGNYSLQFRDSSAGLPAEYISGGIFGNAAPASTSLTNPYNMTGSFTARR